MIGVDCVGVMKVRGWCCVCCWGCLVGIGLVVYKVLDVLFWLYVVFDDGFDDVVGVVIRDVGCFGLILCEGYMYCFDCIEVSGFDCCLFCCCIIVWECLWVVFCVC